jgi:hypothetical protein
VDRDRATNRCRIGFRWFKATLKDGYKVFSTYSTKS